MAAHPRARRDKWLAWAAVVLMGLLVARAARKEAGVLVNNQQFGARFLDREDPYLDKPTGAREHGPYPPSYALVCAPLSLLPTRAARIVWALAQCGALVWTYRLMRRRTAAHWPSLAPHAPLLFAAAVLLVSRYLLRDMAAGGGNLLYGALALAGIDLSLRGRGVAAGLPAALGWVLKPNLAPLWLYYALRARWRAAVSSLVIAALLFLAPGAYFGFARYLGLAEEWVSSVVEYSGLRELHDSRLVPEGMPPAENAMNQSLREAVFRATRPPGDSGAPDVRLVALSADAATWIARGTSLALVILAAAAARRAHGPRREWLAAMAFLPLSLLVSPITWKAHCVVLLPVFHSLCAEAAATRSRALAAFLAAYYVVCNLLNEELLGKHSKEHLQALSIVTWANVALFAVVIVTASRRTNQK